MKTFAISKNGRSITLSRSNRIKSNIRKMENSIVHQKLVCIWGAPISFSLGFKDELEWKLSWTKTDIKEESFWPGEEKIFITTD